MDNEMDKKNSLRIEQMRKSLQNMDDKDFEVSEDLLNSLHDKIMQKVAETEMEAPKMWDKPKRYLRAHYRGWLYTGATMAACFALVATMNQYGVFQPGKTSMSDLDPKSKAIALAAQISPEEFSKTVLGDGLESQFFVDAATESFENLNMSQVKTLMGN